MQRVAIDDVDDWSGPSTVRRPLSRALGAEDVAVNYYELDAGEQFGFGYHRHPDQEEVFYVLEGTATFETGEGDVAVAAGEAVRFAPGEWQLGRNESDDPVRALALGAPADAGETEMVRECEACGGRTPNSIERAGDGDGLVTVCEECDAVTGRYE